MDNYMKILTSKIDSYYDKNGDKATTLEIEVTPREIFLIMDETSAMSAEFNSLMALYHGDKYEHYFKGALLKRKLN